MEKIFKTDLIKNYLKQNNLTEKVFCNLCKISETDLSLVFQHDLEIDLICLFKIAKRLNLHVKELFIK